MRYYVLTDNRTRIKLDPAGYRHMTEAMRETARAVGSGKCTAARMVRAPRGSEGLTYGCPLRTLHAWPPDRARVVTVDLRHWDDLCGYDYTTTDGHGTVRATGSVAGSYDLGYATACREAEQMGLEVLRPDEMAGLRP